MSEGNHLDTGTIAAGVGVLTALGAGVGLLFRAAFRIGVESRTNERIAADLAEMKVLIRTLAEEKVKAHQDIFLAIADLKGRMLVLEKAAHQSRPDVGE